MWQPFAGALVVAIAYRGLDVVLTWMKNDVHVVFLFSCSPEQIADGGLFLPGVYVSAETNDRSLDDVAARHGGGDGRSTQHFWSQVGQDERLLDRFEKS